MARGNEMGTILTLGIAGAAVYFFWPQIKTMLGGFTTSTPTSTPTPPTPSTPAAQPGPAGPTCGTGTMLINGQCVPSTIPDPCVNSVDPGTLAAIRGAMTNGWTSNVQALANAWKIPAACQNSLSAQAAVLAQIKTLGIAGLGHNYMRRGTPMRWTGRRFV